MKQVLFLIPALAIASACIAQERAQADVSITSISLTAVTNAGASTTTQPSTNVAVNSITQTKMAKLNASDFVKCSITVHNENDDDASATVLVVVLPVEVAVITVPSNGVVHKSTATPQFAGYVTFDLGDMTSGQNKTVEFTFTKSKYGNKVGAYSYSGTPDPNPANNYKDASF